MSTEDQFLSVKDMSPMTRNFNCEVIVLQKEGEPITTREDHTIYRFLVADKTGSITLGVWNEMGRDIRPGDILRLFGVNNKLRMGSLFISTLKTCKLKRVGQDTLEYVDKPNMSETEYPQPPLYNNNNPNYNQQQQQQQNRIPARSLQQPQQQQQQQPIENNYNNNRLMQRNFQNGNNLRDTNVHNNGGHPYHRGRGGYRGRGRGSGHHHNNNNNRYHQDLDNPV